MKYSCKALDFSCVLILRYVSIYNVPLSLDRRNKEKISFSIKAKMDI